MACLKIFWTETAIKQRNLIFEHWNNQNKSFDYSKRLRLQIIQNTELLKKHPDIGRKTDVKNVQCLVFGHFSILYKCDNKKIIIVIFWDNRQNIDELLILLQKNSLQ